MILKKQRRFAIICILLALVLLGVTVLAEAGSFSNGMLSGMSSVLLVIGIVRLLRLHRLAKDPQRAAEYEVSYHDERLIYIANKARALTFSLSVAVQVLAGFAAIFVFDNISLGQVLCYFSCAQYLVFSLIYYIYNKKY